VAGQAHRDHPCGNSRGGLLRNWARLGTPIGEAPFLSFVAPLVDPPPSSLIWVCARRGVSQTPGVFQDADLTRSF
jgi:hypothetical protein